MPVTHLIKAPTGKWYFGPRQFTIDLPEFWTTEINEATRFSYKDQANRVRFLMDRAGIKTELEPVDVSRLTPRIRTSKESWMGEKRADASNRALRNFKGPWRNRRRKD